MIPIPKPKATVKDEAETIGDVDIEMKKTEAPESSK